MKRNGEKRQRRAGSRGPPACSQHLVVLELSCDVGTRYRPALPFISFAYFYLFIHLFRSAGLYTCALPSASTSTCKTKAHKFKSQEVKQQQQRRRPWLQRCLAALLFFPSLPRDTPLHPPPPPPTQPLPRTTTGFGPQLHTCFSQGPLTLYARRPCPDNV